MAQASKVDESRERAVSSEPCSTRPNPFDDSDISSRKRRRTSLSGASRSRSVDTIKSDQESSAAAAPPAAAADDDDADEDDGDLAAAAASESESAMKIDTDPTIPTTPEQQQQSIQTQPPSGPRSSRVTINVRTPSRALEAIPSSPSSPTGPTATAPATPVDDVKTSVEDPEVDMSREDNIADTPVSSASSTSNGSSSPAIEIISLEPDDDIDFEIDEPEVTIFGGLPRSLMSDPSAMFPYHEPPESYADTALRLASYLINHIDVGRCLAEWIESYFRFLKGLPHIAIAKSYHGNREVLSSLPDILLLLGNRKTRYPRDLAIREEIIDFYKAFARLTAFFVEFDLKALRLGRSTDPSQLPELASAAYVQALGAITRREEVNYQASQADENYSLMVADILDTFQSFHPNQGGSLAYLKQLAQIESELVTQFPRLTDHLGHICVLASAVVNLNYERLQTTPANQQAAVTARGNISRGYALFTTISAVLSDIVEKHVNHLSHDGASSLLSSLTELYASSLSTDHIVPVELMTEHRQSHPPIAPDHVPEAMAYHWKFTMLRKLIVSSQMQLRVMAASMMCGDLVTFYRRFNDPGNESSSAFLQYVADFLIRTGLVAYIIGPTCHPEITAESGNIIGFLVVSGTYTSKHTDLAWQTITSTQDPRVSDALIRMMNRIAHLLQYEALVYFCEKLNGVPVEAFGIAMREFCDTVLKLIVSKPAYERIVSDPAPFDLCIRLIRQSARFGTDSAFAYPDLHLFAVQKLRELLTYPYTPEGRQRIYLDCLSDIAAKTPSTIGSLWVLYLMTRQYPARELRVLTSTHDFTRILVEELEAAIPAAARAGFPAVLSGDENNPRKEFIVGILFHDPSRITKDLGGKLWHLLVGAGSACQEDRNVAWQVLNSAMKRNHGASPFMSTCFSEYLPALAPEYFCPGALDFVLEGILPLVNDTSSIILDDDETKDDAGIEQLWRMVLCAPEGTIEHQAINSLVNDVYIDSRSILSFSHYRARIVHLNLVNRCLRQLSSAAARLREFWDGSVDGEDTRMVVTVTDQELQQLELLFIRSLSVLREFHRLHQAKSHFSAPDLRSIILDSPKDMEGDSAELKYQSFDGDIQTDVRPLNIGKQNTAASLLASLREATGFNNYRIYYKGRPFVPQESQICKSLEDLQIQNGIILVKRESDIPASPKARVRKGATSVEIEILGHFEELWEYLSMEERLAQEMFNFLIKLPADENILKAIDNPSTSHKDIFPLGQPFKSLYAVHAVREYVTSQQRNASSRIPAQQGATEIPAHSYETALTKAMSLVVSAICDTEVVAQCPSRKLQIELSSSLVDCLLSLLTDSLLPTSADQFLDAPLLGRLLGILSAAISTNDSEGAIKHIIFTLRSILESCSLSTAFMTAFCIDPSVPSVLKELMLNDQRPLIRKNTATLILDKIGNNMIDPDTTTAKFRYFFWPVISSFVRSAITKASTSSEFLELCLTAFRVLRISRSPILDLQKLHGEWSNLLLAYTTFEEVTQPDMIDHVANGLIRLLHAILCGEDTSARREILLPGGIARQIFWRFLYPSTEAVAISESSRPILNPQGRTMLIDIVFSLVEDDPSELTHLMEDLAELVPVYPEGEDFYAYELAQQFERSKAIRASCGYVGLKNLSNTCYLNSLFTQLFMNTDFRQFMLNAEVKDRNYSQNLLFQTQKLFGLMQGTIRRFVNPEECVSSIKTYEDTQIDVQNQMDVDEFYNLLFDRWEGQLLTSEEKRQFRAFYGGQLIQQIASKECKHISERLEPFSAIQCDIKGKTSLQESLEAYVDGEIMEGDNKYKCSECDRHVDAVKRTCLKDIPDNLIFHLKRFDFNVRTMQRSKINDFFSFPSKIDMRPYTVDHLAGPAEGKPAEDIFELVGVLVHSGTAESGHYYSYIRERPTNSDSQVWVEFNDDMVTTWDPSQLEFSCFGGQDLRPPYGNENNVYDKNFSAYMLFYQRSTSLAKEQELIKRPGCSSPLRVELSRDMADFIAAENSWLLRRHCLYDPFQIQFVQMALCHMKLINQEECTEDHAMENLAITMALSHLDQVASRTKDVPDFHHLLKRLSVMCHSCVRCSLAVFEYLYRYGETLRVLVQRNPDADVRQGTVNLVIQVLQIIKSRAPLQYGIPLSEIDGRYEAEDNDDIEPATSTMEKVMRMFKLLWEGFHLNLRSWSEVFEFMLMWVKMGRFERVMFLESPFLRYLLQIIYADQNLDLPPQFSKMNTLVSRRMATRPPSYDTIIALLDLIISHGRFIFTERDELWGADSPDTRFEFDPDSDEEFVYTKQEAKILHTDWNRGLGANIFVDKLIMINQNPHASCSIITNLMKQSFQLEEKILRTLKLGISGHINQQMNPPYLRVAALVFCRSASRAGYINNLIAHVCLQCMCLQNADGQAFFDFQRDVFDSRRKNTGEDPEDVTLIGLDNLPEWVPGLLGYPETSITEQVELFLQDKLFQFGSPPLHDGTDQGRRRADKMVETARTLGIRCLGYLRDNYVSRRDQVHARLVSAFERVIKECSKYFNLKEPAEDEGAREFIRLNHSVFEPLRKLAVEDVEEDASGMLYSDSSSNASSVTAG
ncbi:hypothetical protein B0T22DRAFT_9213 [Podospora appendiculata]|uniref:USP domain-containing protein n=1 Tax=Podospora appendiculata TaxID=314037 RepID=A0AAE0XF06_9PEZI|nr:hypothetical protein B0T22DRAFT_9213 [Podospora appendiculata]